MPANGLEHVGESEGLVITQALALTALSAFTFAFFCFFFFFFFFWGGGGGGGGGAKYSRTKENVFHIEM